MQHATVSPSHTAERTGPQRHLTPDDVLAITEAGSRGGSFICTLCNKKFGYKNGLIRHVRLTHVGEKPYQCNICQRRFGYKHILMEHQNLHFGNRPYACALCDKKFAARSNLIQHRLVHKRPYHCQLCNKRFDRDDQLKKHLFAHPQSRLTCNFCQYTATGQSDLNRHMVEQHSPPVLDTRTPGPVRKSEEHIIGEADSTDAPMPDPIHPPEGPGDEGTPPRSSPAAIASPTSTQAQYLHAAGLSTTTPRGFKVESICQQLQGVEDEKPPGDGTTKDIPCSIGSTVDRYGYAGAESSSMPRRQEETPSYLQKDMPCMSGITIKKEVEDMDSCGRSNSSMSPRTSVHNMSPNLSCSSTDLSPRPSSTQPYTSSCMGLSSPTTIKPSPSVAPVAALPGIHEVFTRRPQRVPPTFTNQPMPNLMSSSDFSLSLFSNSSPFPNPPGNVPTNRPTAQLPPIAQVFRQTKIKESPPSSPPNGLPALEEVLSYYIAQGKLFRCCHCNILFFERGMYFLHASLHGTNSPWECSICHKMCSDKNEFTLHFVNQQHTA